MKKMLFLSGLLVAALLTITGCSPAEEEGADNNNTGAVESPYPNAIAYVLSSEVEGLINETAEHQDEAYKVTFSESGTYTMYISLLPGTLNEGRDTYFYVYDSSENELLGAGYGDLEGPNDWIRKTFEVFSSGDYYIHVYRNENAVTKYKFAIYPSVENGYIQDAIGEKNDVKEMATPITFVQPFTEVNGSLNITDTMDTDDWYKLPLSTTGTYTMYMRLLPGTLGNGDDANFRVYDASENELLRTDYDDLEGPNDWVIKTFEVFSAGDHYIHVNRNANAVTKYEFTIYPSVANGYVQDLEGEKNDVKAMATPITLAQASTEMNGSINMTDVTDTADWYKLPLTTTGSYNLNMEMLAGSYGQFYNLRFVVYDSYDTVILDVNSNSLDQVGDSLVLPFEVSVASDYYIKVYSEGNKAAKYKFSVTAP